MREAGGEEGVAGELRNSAGRGFALAEAVAIMGMIGALAVVAVAGIGTMVDNFRINAATTKTIADIRFAQQQARVHSGWYGIQFQVSPANSYHVYQTDGSTDTDVQDPANLAQNLVADLSEDYHVTISAVDIGDGDKVEFSPEGTPYMDKSGSALASSGTVTLTTGAQSKVIQITRGTGYVEPL